MKILEIQPKYRGKGYAKELMYEFIEKCRGIGFKITLEVESVNVVGLTTDELYIFYEKFGFKRTFSNQMELELY